MMPSIRFAWVAVAALLAPSLVGCDAVAPSDSSSPVADIPLFPVQRDGHWGFMDATGRLAVSATYDAVIPFSEGMAAGRNWKDGRHVWTFFEVDGTEVFEIEAYGMGPFKNGLARAQANGRWGFIDDSGTWVINPYMNDARDFAEGLARVKTTGWQWTFIDADGDVVIDTKYGEISDFSDGRARFEDDDQWGFLDTSGNEAITPQFSEARSFSDGRAAVKVGDRWGFIGTNGQFVLQPQFISAGDYAENRAPVRTENLWEYVDGSGQRVIDPQFDDARGFSEGRAAVYIDGYWTFIKPDGTRIHAPEFDEVWDFEGGIARVRIGEKTGYGDKGGAYVWYPEQ